MFGIGETELVLILVFAFMVFGPDKLPGMGRTLGRALRQFRNAQEGFTQVVQSEVLDPASEAMSDNPKKPNRNRAAEYEEDADIDAPEGEASAPRRTETFAERKKRLAAEKAAAAEAKRAEEAAAAEAVAADDVAEPAGDADTPAEPASAPEPALRPKTAADLYALTPKRTEAPAAEPEPEPETPATETGKEAGSTEA